MENIFHFVWFSFHIYYMFSFKLATRKLTTLFITLQMEQKKWQPALDWAFTAGKTSAIISNMIQHTVSRPSARHQDQNLIYLLWCTRCSESRDQGRHGNSLIRRSRGGLTGSTKSGVLLGMIGLHKWLASQNVRLWKCLTSLHLRHLRSPQLWCTQPHHLSVVK